MIDWFTVAAQIVNFLILVGLLRHFLYGRIVNAMQTRESQIAKRWQEAEAIREQAAMELQQAELAKQEIEQHREELLANVRVEVDAFRDELMESVRAEVDEQRARWVDAIRSERDAFLNDLRKRTLFEVCEIARKVLADLADQQLEVCIVNRFLRMLDSLDETTRESLQRALREGARKVVVQSAFELPDDHQKRIVHALEKQFGEIDVQFQTSSDILCGIAVHTDAHKLAWELRDYLVDLEEKIRNALEEEVSFAGASN